MRSVSLPIQRPWLVATRAKAPTPRSRPGFQDRGRPLTGSRGAMPSRGPTPGAGPAAGEPVVRPPRPGRPGRRQSCFSPPGGPAVGGFEGPADVERPAADGHVLDPGVGRAL